MYFPKYHLILMMYHRPPEIEYFTDPGKMVIRAEFLRDREISFKLYKPGHQEITYLELISNAR